jgi:hypothetical protein
MRVMSLAATELPSGFWSYAHRDDKAERGRILNLCKLLKEEFGALTARDLELFTDREKIAWGYKWRATIDNAITESTFLIAVVTPRYLASEECRRELLQFTANAKARGVAELLFPILYIDVDGLDEDSTDEVKAVIAQTQFVPFTELRLLDEDCTEYRSAVNQMALRLIEIANLVAERAEEGTREGEKSGEESLRTDTPTDDELGLLEAVDVVGQLLPQWQQTIVDFIALMTRIGDVTGDYTPKIAIAGQTGTGPQLAVADQYAKALQPVAQELRDTGARYVDQTLAVSQNLIPILNQLNLRSSIEPLGEETNYFLTQISDLAQTGQESAVAVQDFQQNVRANYGISRGIRRVLTLVHEGAQYFLDAQDILVDWDRRVQKIQKSLGDNP